MSWKASIDDLQQSAQTVENEYDIHLINRAEELNQRYEIKVREQFSRISLFIDGNILSPQSLNVFNHFKKQ